MKPPTAFLVCILSAVAAAMPQMDVRIADKDGRPADEGVVSVTIRRIAAPDGGEDVLCRAVSVADGARLLRIEATLPLEPGVATVFDGRDEIPLKGTASGELLLNDAFPLGAAWGEDCRGRALALGAENKDSYADFATDGRELKISVRAAFMKKGAVYELAFHAFPFDAKYGVRDAFARYYPLYPKRFYRNPDVDPAIFGVAGHYASWRISDPETCRRMNASWEWCIGAARTWGDMRGYEQPQGDGRGEYTWDRNEHNFRDRYGVYTKNDNGKMSEREYFELLDKRLANGYFCGVANAYYVMALARISPTIARRHPDSVAVGKTFCEWGFPYATEVFVFPELSWYATLTNDFAKLARERDISAIAFDVAFPRGVFRGEKINDMKNVSWDEFGPGVVRGTGSASLFEYLRTLPCRKSPYKIGVISNSNGMHISDKLYADTIMAEQTPWDDRPPWPLRRRFIMGEKGLTLWEGFGPRNFATDFNTWPKDARDSMINSLAHCSVHRSFFAGAALPAKGFLSEYTAVMSHAFVRMNDAGWKPVPGAAADGREWEVARYGLGTGAFLAVNNLARDARQISLSVFPGEIATGRAGTVSDSGYLFVPFFGGAATNDFGTAGQKFLAEVGGLGAGVFENLGAVRGEGRLSVRWAGIPGRATLKLESVDFKGEIDLKDACETYSRVGAARRKFAPGSSAGVVYRDDWMFAVGEAMRTKDFAVSEIVRSDDADAVDQADRVASFFMAVLGKKATPPPVRPDASLPARTLRVGGIKISSPDRMVFSRRVKRFLDVLNAVKYPKYRAPTPIPSADRGRYKLYRL